MKGYRKIIHIDMDAFYASIEQRDNPELQNKPVVVGADHPRGVVATASYEARKFGIHSALPSIKAKQLCPNLIFVSPRISVYKKVSAQLKNIFSRYTDLIEPLSLDEAFLDVTENKKRIVLAQDIALDIKNVIRKELNLTASAGVSYNKFLAKIASDIKKPDGLSIIHPVNAERIIGQLPIESFWGVGKVTANKMHRLGIHTGADLRAKGTRFLIRQFGKSGMVYANFARGFDPRPVEPFRIRKSIGCEETYDSDETKYELLRERLLDIADELNARVNRTGFRGRTLILKIKWGNFTQITRSRTVNYELLSKDKVIEIATSMLQELKIHESGVRLIGLSITNPSVVSTKNTRQLKIPFNPNIF